MPRPRQSAPAAEPDRPITAAEVNHLFEALAARRNIGLAVSGGGDSTALMWLAAQWAAGLSNPPRLHVLTVDHGFRAASAGEARQVVDWAAALGMAGDILREDCQRPDAGLQRKAREMRYRLMARWCREAECEVLVTAHTCEDQAETFLMRLARGSGVVGLGAMAEVAMTIEGLLVVRPLLAISRARLRATLRAAGHSWIEDPSNENTQFERVRMRKIMPKFAELGLTTEALARSASRLARAARPLLQSSAALAGRAIELRPQGYAIVKLDEFQAEAAEIRILALQELLKSMGGAATLPRLMAIERLDEWISRGAGQARTLAGCRIARRSKTLIIGREPGRIASDPVGLPSGAPIVWDNRFKVTWPRSPGGAAIWPAGLISGLERARDVPAFVQASLPAILAEGRLVGLPYSAGAPADLHCQFIAMAGP